MKSRRQRLTLTILALNILMRKKATHKKRIVFEMIKECVQHHKLTQYEIDKHLVPLLDKDQIVAIPKIHGLSMGFCYALYPKGVALNEISELLQGKPNETYGLIERLVI